jgi:hypothetical protein
VLVLAGDSLTRPLYEYFEAAGLLDPLCFDTEPPDTPPEHRGLVPGEGLVACLLETETSAAARGAAALGRYEAGWIGSVDPLEHRQASDDDLLSGPFAFDGAAIFESSAVRHDSDGTAPRGLACSDIAAAARGPLARGSRVGSFGGTGLWNVGEALTLSRTTSADAILATNVDARRTQGSATFVTRGDRS